MGYQLIARALSATLFALGLWCLAQAGIFSTSHQVTSGGGGPSNIWSTTSSLATNGVAGQNLTFVAKWVGGTPITTPPGSNAHITVTFKAAVTTLLSGVYFGGVQTLAAQCSGTLRVWNFASAPITILTQTSIGTAPFTTGQISVPNWPGTPFAFAIDTANGQNRPSLTTPNSTNTTPAGATGDFLVYTLAKGSSPGEAATQCKSSGYSTPTNNGLEVIGITSFP